MKKTLWVLAGAVLLLAMVLLIDHRRDASRQADQFAFDTTQKADVTYLKIVLQKDTTEMIKTGGKWVAAADSIPVDTAKINKSLSYLLRMQDKEIVSSNPSRLVEYGLDTAQAKHIEWRDAGGKKVRIELGKISGADYRSMYWKWEDRPVVYRTPGFTYDIATSSADWKDHSLVTVDARDVKSIEVNWRDSADQSFHYKLEAVNDTLVRMMEPDTALVKKTEAMDLLAQAGQFVVDDFVVPGDTNVAKARLDTPMVAIRIDLKSGKSHEIKGGKTFNDMVYTRHPFWNKVVMVSSWRFKRFEKMPYELMADTARARLLMPPAPVVKKPSAVKKKH
jgi:hypothetical protein